jgi:hypothetical protein
MNELILAGEEPSGSFHRMEESAGISPGTFWRCIKDVEGIDAKHGKYKFEFEAGDLHVMTRLEFFDGKLHSVVLLDDPRSGKDSGVITLPLFHEHFEWVSVGDAKAYRDSQIAGLMDSVKEIQNEMTEAQVNPAILAPVISKGVAQWEADEARRLERDEDDDEPSKNPENLPSVSRSSNGRFDLTAAVTNRIQASDIALFSHAAKREGKIAEIKGKWLQEKIEQMTRVMNRLPPFYAEHAAIGLATAHDALEMADDVQKGLRSLRLYTGEGTVINPLMTGTSAAYDEPLTVYQRKLFMDEEFAVWTDVDRLFDHTRDAVFFEAMVENAALRQQLIPAQRGVLAMAVRRTDVKYDVNSISDAMQAMGNNKLNKALFLLVRDGENWYQVYSDEPSHELSARLFPTRSEMGAIFDGIDGETIGFQDLNFTHRAKEFDQRSLAYKRFLILACGLDHRKQLFGHFYPRNEALNFISQSFQNKYMRFISDDDGDVMLGDNVGSVHELIKQNQSQLAAGSRVLVFGRDLLEHDAAPGAFDKGDYDRHSSRTVYNLLVEPQQKCIMLTVRRIKDDLVVDLPVKRKHNRSFHGYSSRDLTRTHYNVRVALNKLSGDGLRYLVTETLSADELRPFITNRRSRASHLDFLYGFKLAITVLEKRETANAGTMKDLRDLATRVYALTNEQADIAAVSAVQAWRQKNLDADLLPMQDTAAFKDLADDLAEVVSAFKHAIPKIDKAITELGGSLVRLMRGKRGTLIAYYEQPDSERDLRIHQWQWVGRRVFTAAGKPAADSAPETVTLFAGRIVGETELFSRESAFIEKGYASSRTRSDAEPLRRALIERLDGATQVAEALSTAFKGYHMGIGEHAWLVLTSGEKTKRCVADRDEVALPIGVNTKARYVVAVRANLRFLIEFYGSDAQRAAAGSWCGPDPKPRHRKQVEKDKETPALYLSVENYWHPEKSELIAYDPTSSQNYKNLPSWADGRRLTPQESIEVFLSSVKPVKDEKVVRASFDGKFMDPGTTWFAPSCFNESGVIDLARLFPEYPGPVEPPVNEEDD